MAGGWPPTPLPALDEVVDDELRLRPWQPDDATALAAAWADPLIRTWTNPPQGTVADAARWIAGEAERRARALALDIVIERGGVVAGEVGLTQFGVRAGTCALGFWVAADHRGHGLAARSVAAVVATARAGLGLRDALATTHPDNVASIVTLERAGFRRLTRDGDRLVYACRQTDEYRDIGPRASPSS